MKVRAGLLLTSAASALTLGLISQAFAADQMVLKAEPAPPAGWWTHGVVEVGGRFFLNNPSRDTLAKFYEYRDLRPGPIGDIYFAAGSNDGLYGIDFWANNIGYEDQAYLLSMSKAGEHYLNLGWDQTPHVYGIDARTLYNGVGGNTLTIPSGVRAALGGSPDASDVATAAANSANIDVKIRRDTGSVDYRWTPDDHWDVKVDYSHLRREGTQVLGAVTYVGNGAGAGTRVPLEVPKPVADTTQTGNVSGEYAGVTPWGKKFNVSLGYGFSLYNNDYSAFTFQNPWVLDGGNLANNVLNNQYSLSPSNDAHFARVNGGVDLPWKSRYVGSFQYSTMRQNDAFLPNTINPAAPPVLSITRNGVSIGSLDAKTDTTLLNNAITTRITPDLKSTLRYRYYDFNNGDGPTTVTNAVMSDNTNLVEGATTIYPVSYTKQNAGADLTWRALRWLTVGAGYGWERWDRDHRDTNVTDEHMGKAFLDARPVDWTRVRASVQYSERRYDQYVNAVPANNVNMRMFDQANRNRTLGKVWWDLYAANNVTITPTAGFRNDDYQTNPFSPDFQYGLTSDNSWNAGMEVAWSPSRDFSVFAAYIYEDAFRQIYNSTSATGARLNLEMRDRIHTFMVGSNVVIIPGKLDVKTTYTISRSGQDWGMFSGPSLSGPPYTPLATFPQATNNFQRVDVISRYVLDPALMQRLGWKGESFVKVRYMWERNDMENWQTIDPQLGWVINSTNTTTNRMVMMQWDKPDYNVHLVALAFGVKW